MDVQLTRDDILAPSFRHIRLSAREEPGFSWPIPANHPRTRQLKSEGLFLHSSQNVVVLPCLVFGFRKRNRLFSYWIAVKSDRLRIDAKSPDEFKVFWARSSESNNRGLFEPRSVSSQCSLLLIPPVVHSPLQEKQYGFWYLDLEVRFCSLNRFRVKPSDATTFRRYTAEIDGMRQTRNGKTPLLLVDNPSRCICVLSHGVQHAAVFILTQHNL